jgi:hypothetical protein
LRGRSYLKKREKGKGRRRKKRKRGGRKRESQFRAYTMHNGNELICGVISKLLLPS